jgi:cephalosporin-C deacetylase-like acetyl esterase
MKRTSTRLILSMLFFCITPFARAQTDWAVLDAKTDAPRKMLHRYLLAEAQKHFDARRAEIATLKTPDDVRKRQAMLRTRMIEALGGFPAKTPLNALVVGKEQRDGYRIEKVIYESRPSHHVTATLYLPDGKGPFPGCIMPIGHSMNGKAAEYIQRGSILLAKNGIAVLAYDPIGQGERRQLLDKLNKAAIPNSTSEHTLIGVGALLVGQGTATYRMWDGMRSLDYLESRPEIDAKRLGCTGCSGGGTMTSYLMALDDRIVCAAPSCYITSLERLFATIGPQDAEQNITGQVALGIEHADYLTMHAPRPTLLATATQDFFDIHATWTSFREATRIFGILGHGERVNLVEYDTKHGYPKPQREAVTRWMRRWLLEKDDAIVEPSFAIAKDADLQCTRTGQVLDSLQGKSAFQISAEYEQQYAKDRSAKLAKLSREDKQAAIRKLIALPDKVPAATLKRADEQWHETGKLKYRKLLFETEPGVVVPTLHFKSVRDASYVVLYIHGLGKAAETEPGGQIEKFTQNGIDVLALDLRGMGETAPGQPSAKPGYFGTDFRETYLALHLNRPLLGQRVFDLLAVNAFLRSEQKEFPKKTTVLWAKGSAVPIALHAAALEPSISSVVTEGGVVSWAAVVRSPINNDQLTNVVPGALKVYDLPDLATLIAPRRLQIRAVDPQGGTMKIADVRAAYAECVQAYGDKKGQLTLEAK